MVQQQSSSFSDGLVSCLQKASDVGGTLLALRSQVASLFYLKNETSLLGCLLDRSRACSACSNILALPLSQEHFFFALLATNSAVI